MYFFFSSFQSLPQTTLGAANGGLTEYSSSAESVQESTPEKDIVSFNFNLSHFLFFSYNL